MGLPGVPGFSVEPESYWHESKVSSVMATQEEDEESLGIRADVHTAVTGEEHSPGLQVVKKRGRSSGSFFPFFTVDTQTE